MRVDSKQLLIADSVKSTYHGPANPGVVSTPTTSEDGFDVCLSFTSYTDVIPGFHIDVSSFRA